MIKSSIVGKYEFLTAYIPLKETDLVREPLATKESFLGEDATNWRLVGEAMPFWVGKTLKEFYTRRGGEYTYDEFEVIRKIEE